MMIFWWTNRGYWTLLILFLSGMAVTIIQEFLDVSSQGPGFAVALLIIATIANWIAGSRMNGRPPTWPGVSGLRHRLIYRAHNRFMGLPMESWSVAMAAAAIALLVRGIVTGG